MISPSAFSANHRNHSFRRPSGVSAAVSLIVAGVAVVTVVAGCSSGSSGKKAGKGTETVATKSKAAGKALELAATQSQQVKSLTASITVHSKGGTAAGNLTGTVNMQLKPTTIIKATFNSANARSQKVELDEILTAKSIYFKDPAFTRATGKPWVEADLAQLSTKVGVSLGSLLQNLESSNPLDQAKLFAASKNAHIVGTTMINGVSTTEYVGTYSPRDALAELSPSLRKVMEPALKAIGPNPVQFEVWIDGQHLVRQAQDTDNVRGQIITTTLDVTSINKPVHVKLPSPGEIAPLPKI